ncbi:16S rRNA (cytosine(1402)-N(4))-methyltransferase RsmH [Azovibrio restrictus]|uniref:16S rRNA (cytosine(1402)-N(4))-methyltransferase RsmH n=1 Tax=Azovibrio restrictus TaxID=146938 RepID=UPI0026E941EB|nr:16S rRNA (cytosine(1402)-N(4))-methyltransferase RsmH [Azovibrio restrictus]
MNAGGAHVTVLLKEAVEALSVRAGGVYLDATFGRGGHSRAILAGLGEAGRLLALDRDPMAIAAGRVLEDSRFTLLHRPFSELSEGAVEAGMTGFDGILFDLGVSSPQLDDGGRGFSFRHDAPLDMRMDTTRGETAAEWLARAETREITEVIRNYGEERFAFQIAKKVVAARAERPVTTTGEFAALVREAVRTREPGQDPATRSFQALRIHVNQELEQLALALPRALDLLNPGGRLVVISFHSLEDRIVKRFMRDAAAPADALPRNLPLRADQLPKPRLRLLGRAIKPSDAEVAANPRARSAVMRVAEKI